MDNKYATLYQVTLITLSVVGLFLVGAFIYRELFPEYKEYQETYVALEAVRAQTLGEPPPPFSKGIEQIVYRTQDTGPEQIDRCISCHVATDLPHFSPTRIARDINGQIVYDDQGNPEQEPNPDYIFNLPGTDALRYQTIDGLPVDMAVVLAAHPLMGAETRPFEYHPVEEYGCTSCHSGNGRSVNARRAHGPVFDEMYQPSSHSLTSPYLEVDPVNDPLIARIYNFEPDDDLLFQTTPLLPGSLMEAKCVQCHQSGVGQMHHLVAATDVISQRKQRQIERIQQGITNEIWARQAFAELKTLLQVKGRLGALEHARKQLQNPALLPEELDAWNARLRFLDSYSSTEELLAQIGKREEQELLFDRVGALDRSQEALTRLQNATKPLEQLAAHPTLTAQLAPQIDGMLSSYTRGKDLYITQACYACHRIAGLSRAGIGPDLTAIGLSYPWYVKLAIVWPQATLATSTMPNYKLDHQEVENLLAFLMAQRDDSQVLSNVEKSVLLRAWEMGQKLPWERPIAPSDITNVRYGMTLFATQGCAACHKLQGFTGNVSYADTTTQKEHIAAQQWFFRRFPEQISGHDLVHTLNQYAQEIDERIVYNEQTETILEHINQQSPGTVETFYTSFKFAQRHANDPIWQDRIQRVLVMFIQEYGLGRDICPRLNWSGVWRDDQWLTGHFLNPSAYSARSIMPPFPFHLTKFYALNHTLHVLGNRNRDQLREIWQVRGFDPQLAYQLQCAACHGTHKQGNGPIAEWIYPIPKNLRNATFLRQLTREEAIRSITHGVQGTPMPPWGEAAIPGEEPVMTEAQIEHLVDWLFSSLPGTSSGTELTQKWDYTAQDVVTEYNQEEHTTLTIDQLFTDKHDQTFIRSSFYTPVNIAQGEELFRLNCAACHGNEGTGAGPRAEALSDAKPRMLTNVPWLRTRDDLRLLRSIKFGVPGTSMQAWGDQTTSLQRVQLITYIRTLSEEIRLRNDLNDTLYDTFDTNILAIEACRTTAYQKIEALQNDYEAAATRRQRLLVQVEEGEATPAQAAAAYEVELEHLQTLNALKEQDRILQTLISQVIEEKQLYHALGVSLLAKNLDEQTLHDYFRCIAAFAHHFFLETDCVEIAPQNKTHAKQCEQELLESFDQELARLNRQITIVEGKLYSREKALELQELDGQRGDLINLRTKLLNTLRRAQRIENQQVETYDRYRASLGT